MKNVPQSPSFLHSETSTGQASTPPSSESSTTQPSSTQPSIVTRSDLLATVEDWLCNLGIRRIGEIPVIKVDLSESDTAYTILADIPGVNKEDIKVDLDSNRVSITVEKKKEVEQKEGERIISRERSLESISRSIRLDAEIDVNKAQAKYENGVLRLTMPKKHVKAIKQLEIM
ncbi:Hsp20/alpha crystallin family protein [Nitrosomonas sp. Is37]|uniref:Hsp20/alpha crystallin family protein n=1 Tax=Nitrosomonas sp. Is37 TaxID=3080535 RepID=UPI00294B3A1B|nr:Hsp20 family protein [Nitrosomonas sp. Is37]MDV6343179.1 Hsp20 family protein [Nitrosomonas sp. Is37]